MPFAPETVHKGIDELDGEAPVEFRRHCFDQVFEGLLEERIVKPRLILPVRIPQVSFRRGAVFCVIQYEIDLRYPVRARNPVGREHEYSRVHSSARAARCVCCFSWPGRKQA